MDIVFNVLLCLANGIVFAQLLHLFGEARQISKEKSVNFKGLGHFLNFKSVLPLTDITYTVLSKSAPKKRIRPLLDQERPVNIHVSLSIYDITSVKDTTEEFTVICVVKQTWKDDRLAFSGYSGSIPLNYNQVDRIWTPDIGIMNLKSGALQQLTVPNRQLFVSPDGTLSYSQRLSLTLSCKMDLFLYPMDNQTCFIEFESYGYPIEHVNLLWDQKSTPVNFLDRVVLSEYEITNVTHSVCVLQLNQAGNFSCLRVYFHLKRRLSVYLKSNYLPSSLFVMLSWGPFWVDPTYVPARTSLSVLTVMTIIGQNAASVKNLGAINCALDIWMSSCLVLIFGAFTKILIAHTLFRYIKKGTTEEEVLARTMKRGGFLNPVKIRKIAKFAFPLLFIAFNVMYWSYFLAWGKKQNPCILF